MKNRTHDQEVKKFNGRCYEKINQNMISQVKFSISIFIISLVL